MNGRIFLSNDATLHRINEKLYMNMRTADVSFVFDDHRLRIPAHKCILSVGSPVFDAMFYGPLAKESSDIYIHDACAESFKEFLQFFYLATLDLTTENLIEVINLCRKYKVSDGLRLCEIPLKSSLTIDNICWAYAIALDFDLMNLRTFCEEQIQNHPADVLASKSFLSCAPKILNKILEFAWPKCTAPVIVDACMEWATSDIGPNRSNILDANPRHKLGTLFNRIPFAGISINQLFKYTWLAKYDGIFTDQEIRIISEIIMTNQLKSCAFEPNDLFNMPKLNCDRRPRFGDTDYFDIRSTFFNSNQKLLLAEFFLPELAVNLIFGGIRTIQVKYTIHASFRLFDEELLAFGTATLTSERETRVILPKPVAIDERRGYEIRLIGMDGALDNLSYTQAVQLKEIVELDGGAKIQFYPGSQLTSRLVFLKIATV